ncbi:hypothetical protein HPB49_023823 [Dermacentor silvarum]|uniref:Uncharacterized protein n=1 Tax=Dermacentor silvarum TaxID=543639 RepID=A0ACB8E449_DERSI|nr:hypothetical protein HPB49_023823 [Dermacentor silvarum]
MDNTEMQQDPAVDDFQPAAKKLKVNPNSEDQHTSAGSQKRHRRRRRQRRRLRRIRSQLALLSLNENTAGEKFGDASEKTQQAKPGVSTTPTSYLPMVSTMSHTSGPTCSQQDNTTINVQPAGNDNAAYVPAKMSEMAEMTST